jgi:hypothetical protein
MFAVFQVPNPIVFQLIEQGQKIQAIKVWQGQDHTLLNGVRVRPRLQRCMDMVRAVEMGFGDIPLCIPVDGYTICARTAGDTWD